MNYIVSLFYLLLLTACANKKDIKMPDRQAQLSIEQLSNKDYHFVMGNNLIAALISPEDGGKLTSLKYNGKEILTPQSTDSLAYGSTFWPSPHNWGWPPASSIDRDTYSSVLDGNRLVMKGPVIENLGLQFIKYFTIDVEDTILNFTYQIVNVSEESKKVAPWEVTRVPKGGFTFFPIVQDYPSFKSVTSGKFEHLYYCSVDGDYSGKSQKINFNAEKGWLAHAMNGILLIKKFRDVPIDEIAPKEGDVEIYIDNDTNYIELENQGAFTELLPGDTLVYRTDWYLRENTIKASLENLEKMEVEVLSILSRVTQAEQSARVTRHTHL